MLHSGEEGRQRPDGARAPGRRARGRCREPRPRPPLRAASALQGPCTCCGHRHGRLSSPRTRADAFLRARPLRGLTRGHADLRQGHPGSAPPAAHTAAPPISRPPSSPGCAEACPARPARLSHASHPRAPPAPNPGRAGTAWRRPGRQPLDPEVLPGACLDLLLAGPGHVVARRCKGGGESPRGRGRVRRGGGALEARVARRPSPPRLRPPHLHFVPILWSNEQDLRPPGERPASSPGRESPCRRARARGRRARRSVRPHRPRPGDSGGQRIGKTRGWWKEGKAPTCPAGAAGSQPGLPCAAREGKAGTA
ncbi:translation initiation factor IF-2-like [Canis lupus dingo]|uniref:translation initiation factor IF-2-like n=1 Tax=Canis lupus dingo TaxID=286419 RepID=UPI0020C412B1|nr:translation initiation factor IF-2-like [Canis lupus dingo]